MIKTLGRYSKKDLPIPLLQNTNILSMYSREPINAVPLTCNGESKWKYTSISSL